MSSVPCVVLLDRIRPLHSAAIGRCHQRKCLCARFWFRELVGVRRFGVSSEAGRVTRRIVPPLATLSTRARALVLPPRSSPPIARRLPAAARVSSPALSERRHSGHGRFPDALDSGSNRFVGMLYVCVVLCVCVGRGHRIDSYPLC